MGETQAGPPKLQKDEAGQARSQAQAAHQIFPTPAPHRSSVSGTQTGVKTETERDMGELSSGRRPQILVNGDEELQDAPGDKWPEDRVVSAGRDAQTRVQSVFQQVRQQIRSQAGEKSSIQQLVQRVRDRETERGPGEAEGPGVAGGRDVQRQETQTYQRDPMEEELCALLEEKLEASKKALKEELEVQISQVILGVYRDLLVF
ncbi:uncharacterized protein LOC116674831, partial [Etheostoma spectabile]|uniref:uncharacterized protein LOC116674831 n=1 Tax=Etheostoma spectabile TaxID=54343 RepID=UPI0013AF6FD9